MGKADLLAYWGPVLEVKDGSLTPMSKSNLSLYEKLGFSHFILPAPNGYEGPFLGESGKGSLTDLFAILDGAKSLGLQVIVREENILRLSNVRLPLVGPKKIILVQKEDGDWVFPDSNAKEKDGVVSYLEKDGRSQQVQARRILRQWSDLVSFAQDLKKAIAPYACHPSFAGFDLWDEPAKESFSASIGLMSALRLLEKDFGKCLYFQQCLLPRYGFNEKEEFEDYLSSYAALLKRSGANDVLETDVYPLCEGTLHWKEGTYQGPYLQKTYVSSLVSQARLAQKEGLRSVVCLQSFGNPGVFRDVESKGLLWQAGIALALAFKGISYYPFSRDTHAPFYTSSLVDGSYQKGYVPGMLYEAVKKLNHELPALLKENQSAHLVALAFFPLKRKNEYESCVASHTYFEAVENDPLPLSFKTPVENLLVSESLLGKKRRFAFCNLADLTEEETKEITFFLPGVSSLRGTSLSRAPFSLKGERGVFTLSLEAGECVYLEKEGSH
jgi:hypothetical protein